MEAVRAHERALVERAMDGAPEARRRPGARPPRPGEADRRALADHRRRPPRARRQHPQPRGRDRRPQRLLLRPPVPAPAARRRRTRRELRDRLVAGEEVELPGAVRPSFGIFNDEPEVDELLRMIRVIRDRGLEGRVRRHPRRGRLQGALTPQPAKPTRRPKVEIRRVRGGLELRIDGTQASVHRPGAALTGVVWWALRVSDPAPAPDPPPARAPAGPGRRQRGPGAASPRPGRRDRGRRARPRGRAPRPAPLRPRPPGDRAGRWATPSTTCGASDGASTSSSRTCSSGRSRLVRKPDWLLGEGYPLIRRRLRPRRLRRLEHDPRDAGGRPGHAAVRRPRSSPSTSAATGTGSRSAVVTFLRHAPSDGRSRAASKPPGCSGGSPSTAVSPESLPGPRARRAHERQFREQGLRQRFLEVLRAPDQAVP